MYIKLSDFRATSWSDVETLSYFRPLNDRGEEILVSVDSDGAKQVIYLNNHEFFTFDLKADNRRTGILITNAYIDVDVTSSYNGMKGYETLGALSLREGCSYIQGFSSERNSMQNGRNFYLSGEDKEFGNQPFPTFLRWRIVLPGSAGNPPQELFSFNRPQAERMLF